MSFLNKEERTKCWGARDDYWKCLSENAPQHSSTSGEKVPDACKKLRKLFETSCPGTWVKHFDRKRTYEQFKQKMEQGVDPLEEHTKESKK
ncbi:cytochrome c oxidase assembly factor 6 homolog [Musca domestica]|uniref:Cytochrome c oxidase assembly factor 6 homolog n=1 Tax=Musca domestica TaxID=7370 RepID=A0A1I8NFD1_MUSDO|nr:cytochrome c oxidase assembly factor 6 homolog [Musca domestica]XP_061392141.1 cytochrome c oxidase assembly factor 6 homolog [Musca vetustissima]